MLRAVYAAPRRLRTVAQLQRVVRFSPCLTGPVGEALDRPELFAAALSETAPLECVFFFAWVFPPLLSLVDWGM
jgi:hypothetical protein